MCCFWWCWLKPSAEIPKFRFGEYLCWRDFWNLCRYCASFTDKAEWKCQNRRGRFGTEGGRSRGPLQPFWNRIYQRKSRQKSLLGVQELRCRCFVEGDLHASSIPPVCCVSIPRGWMVRCQRSWQCWLELGELCGEIQGCQRISLASRENSSLW